jgi:hypothetical protein
MFKVSDFLTGAPDLAVLVECKRGDDRPRDSQIAWARKTGAIVVVLWFPDKDSPKAHFFVGYDEFYQFLNSPTGEPQAHPFYTMAYTLEYGAPKKENVSEAIKDTHNRSIPNFDAQVRRGRTVGSEEPQPAGPSGVSHIPFRER